MARLTDAQWALLRQQWQTAAAGGFHWLTEAGGGPWRISREGIRRRARAEGWTKRDPGPPGAATGRVDQLACSGGGGGAGPGEGLFDCAVDAAEVDVEEAQPLRDAVLLQHRRDWLRLRRLLSAAVAGGGGCAGGTDAVRRAKLAAEVVRAIQEGETLVWELDADRIDFEAMSDQELKRFIARGHRAR
jgi:hypothetical protein